jgi:hypothetical protein
MQTDTDVMTIEAEVLADLTIRRPPSIVLEEARQAAVCLKDVLDSKEHKVMMNDEQYLEFEDWQTVGKFYGVTCGEEGEPLYVEFGITKGFKATCVALHNGKVISRATAFCLSDEEKWGERNKYGYAYCKKSGGTSVEDPGPTEIIWMPNPNKPGRSMPKKERVLLGQESVPLYQLASMAQTRANSKVLRNVLSWVVVLAGYKPTPAEEMPNVKIVEIKPVDGAGQVQDVLGMTHQASDAPAPADDPSDPYRARLRTCERSEKAINATFKAIPSELQQDCYAEYTTQLISLKLLKTKA